MTTPAATIDAGTLARPDREPALLRRLVARPDGLLGSLIIAVFVVLAAISSSWSGRSRRPRPRLATALSRPRSSSRSAPTRSGAAS